MKITLNRPSVYECEGIRLVAGVNNVTADTTKFLKNKFVKRDIESGVITVGAKNEPEPTGGDGYTAMTKDQLLAIGKERDLDVSAQMKKEDIIAALELYDEDKAE